VTRERSHLTVAGYVPREGDVVVFPLAPTAWNRGAEYTVTTVWDGGADCTLHRYEDGADYVYPAMSAASMRELGVTLVRPGQPADGKTRAADAAARAGAVKEEVVDEVIDGLNFPASESSVRDLAGEVFDRAFALGRQPPAAGAESVPGRPVRTTPARRRPGSGSGPSPR
jgi:hypothetical protein